MLTQRKPAPASARPPEALIPEVRVGRNFIRKGDPIKAVLPCKTQRSRVTFVGLLEGTDTIAVTDSRGFRRYVSLATVQRIAVTKGGVRKEASRG